MAKLILNDIGSFSQTAITTINQNNDKIELALENTLSRDGTIPNQMEADLDMNHKNLLNLDNLHIEELTIGATLVTEEQLVLKDDLADVAFTADYNDLINQPPIPQGTIQTVGLEVPLGFSVTGSPVTTSGTFSVGYAAGYQGYTSAESSKLNGIEAGAEVNLVTSVSGRVGDVVLSRTDVGLANVDNTTDLNKPISTATQNALNLKADTSVSISAGTGLTGGGTLAASRTLALSSTSIASLALADSAVQPSTLSAGLAGKFDNPAGTTSQYIRGDGSLTTFPSIPAAQVNSDWNAVSGLAQILNKPTLATVATSGVYNDLSGKPTLGTLAAVSPTGTPDGTKVLRDDFTWVPQTGGGGGGGDVFGPASASDGVMVLFDGTSGKVIKAGSAPFDGVYSSLSGIPSTFTPSAHNHNASDINAGTLADARIPALAISKTTGLQTALDGKASTDVVTTTVNGLMIAADKVKLDGIATGATANTGTVTSVALSVPTGLSVSGSPISTSGTFAITFAAGYSIPTTAKQGQWDTAYGWGNHASVGYLTSAAIGASVQGYDATTTKNAATQTLTNKRVTPRIGTTASSATPTPDGDAHDVYTVTALAAAATFGAPTGTPTDGQKLIIRVKDNGTARTLAWNGIYRGVGAALPATTVLSKTLYLGFIFNSADTKWDLVAASQES